MYNIFCTDFDPDNPDMKFRGTSATNKEVRIGGASTDSKYVPIKHESRKGSWTTVCVEWKHFGDCRSLFCINDNEVRGVFSSLGFSSIEDLVVDLMEVEH